MIITSGLSLVYERFNLLLRLIFPVQTFRLIFFIFTTVYQLNYLLIY